MNIASSSFDSKRFKKNIVIDVSERSKKVKMVVAFKILNMRIEEEELEIDLDEDF